jgi:hypothetical protein
MDMKWVYTSYGIEGSRIGSNDSILKIVKRPFVEEEAFFKCTANYGGWNFNSGNYLFTTDTK